MDSFSLIALLPPKKMSRSKVFNALRVFVAISLFFATASGLSVDCQSPNDGQICTMAVNCPKKVKELEKIYDSDFANFQLHYFKNLCGNKDGEDLMCCDSPTELEVTEDVSQHPNAKLLRQDICGPVSQDRITGGNKTRLFELPWMALLMLKTRYGSTKNCGGTVISDRYVLTAARCIRSMVPTHVRLGEHDLKSLIDCEEHFDGETTTETCAPLPQDIPIEDIIVHPDYIGKPFFYRDVALLRLSHPVDFTTDAVKPICLPIGLSLQTLNLTGKMVDVAGWGLTDTGITMSNELLKATIPVLKFKCAFWPPISTLTQICAGDAISGSGTCRGDSGGPLTYVGEVDGSIRTIQYGISSFGNKACGVHGQPRVFTRLPPYLKWILDNMKP